MKRITGIPAQPSPASSQVSGTPENICRADKAFLRPQLCTDVPREVPFISSIATSELPAVAICSPALRAVSGVSTHAALLLGSTLNRSFRLLHFELGSEGRSETASARTIRTLLTPWRLLRFLHAERPAILHLNSSMALRPIIRDGVLALLARACGVRVVMQIHGGQLPQALCRNRSRSGTEEACRVGAREQVAGRFFKSPGAWVRQRLLQKLLALNDRVVVLSREEQASYQQFCPGLKIERIPNAIDLGTSEFCPTTQAHDAARHAAVTSSPVQTPSKSPLRLVYLGRLITEKGLFESLDAVAQLIKAGRRLDFTIAGAGPAAQALAHRIRALELETIVRLTGPVGSAAKAEIWRQADVLLLPSYSEGLPYALLEAMASGTPAITCAVGAIPDVMQDGVHGLFVPPHDSTAIADAIARLDDARPLLAAMAIAGRCRVREAFSADRLAADFAALYGDLLDACS